MKLAVGVVTESGAGVFQSHGVKRMSGGEGVTSRDSFFHVVLSIFASCHCFFFLDLGLRASHVEASCIIFGQVSKMMNEDNTSGNSE